MFFVLLHMRWLSEGINLRWTLRELNCNIAVHRVELVDI
jgi:hypothetical protein